MLTWNLKLKIMIVPMTLQMSRLRELGKPPAGHVLLGEGRLSRSIFPSINLYWWITSTTREWGAQYTQWQLQRQDSVAWMHLHYYKYLAHCSQPPQLRDLSPPKPRQQNRPRNDALPTSRTSSTPYPHSPSLLDSPMSLCRTKMPWSYAPRW